MQEISVSIQETTNPTILKFSCNSTLIQGGSYEYANIDEAKNSPLAQQLFYLPFVKKVYITANFIAIQRYDIVGWNDVQEEVREQIELYLNSGALVVNESIQTNKKEPIEVYAESTPNPAVMKFGVNKVLTENDFEFKNIEGDMLPLDLILEGGPELALELDLAWVAVGRQRPSDWVRKYSDRLIAVHVKDRAPEGECLDEDGWEDVGHGTMDWVDTISAVRETACQFFVMEHDNPKDDARFARRALAAANTF